MRMVRSVLVDTSAIFAIISAEDRFHTRAEAIYGELLEWGDRLHTTSYVLVEASALVHHRIGFEPLREFIQSIQGLWDIFWVDRVTHEEAWSRMVRRGGGRINFVDWSTIVVAESTRSTIFTFDSDFAQEGLTVIPALQH
jgi:predicted nucleic acid-binding protein